MRQLYEQRLARFRSQLQKEEALGLRLGWSRAGTFALGVLGYLAFDTLSGFPGQVGGGVMTLAFLLFGALVIWHRRVKARRRWHKSMVRVNQVALARLARDWDALPPSPYGEVEATHPYALDLDVWGRASVFRLLTTPTLPPGVETLRAWLLEPASAQEVRERQEAARELAPQLDLRQGLEARGQVSDLPSSDSLDGFLAWAEQDGWLGTRPGVLAVARVIPVLTLLLFVLYGVGWLPGPWWLLSMGCGLGFGRYHQEMIHREMTLASGGQERFGRYASVLRLLLEAKVEAPALRALQASVRKSPLGAEGELRSLGRRVAWAEVRYSTMVHAPLQALFVWDVHVLQGLERWKARAGTHVRGWLEALGRLEALSALATLRADHPDWCFPELEEGGETLTATALGHPLLPPDSCVRNDLTIGPPGTFLFLTGSNMSGKSTLLRAAGLNAVLAQAGAPVCAEAMALPPVRVQTSMRTADSLSEGLSQYMAELNRIRKVVEGARREDNAALYLLDEPLQGTNEAERRVAVQLILGHLLDAGAIGAVATHDLHLDETERLLEAARAVHLVGTVREGKEGPLLSFDYRLRPGRATSTNALALLRAAGLGPGPDHSPTGP